MVETYGANFEESDVLPMFPTFVWKAQVTPSVRQGIEDDVLAKLDEMRRDTGEPAPGRGWQIAEIGARVSRFPKGAV